MPLKIIGAGFGRTSTLSTYTALNKLGFPCYHMIEVLRNKANKSHINFWHHVANTNAGTQHDWEQVFSKYTATVDNPACCVWQELLIAYPQAKVLLTIHPAGAEAWYESTVDTIYSTEYKWQFKVLSFTIPFARKFSDMSRKLIWQRSHKDTMHNREKAIAQYYAHIEAVKAAVPPERLLIFSADQGWKPLCDFLDLPIPKEDFPNVNDRTSIKKMLNKQIMVAYGILVAGIIGFSALLYGIFRLLF